jgi:hypothetical protein
MKTAKSAGKSRVRRAVTTPVRILIHDGRRGAHLLVLDPKLAKKAEQYIRLHKMTWRELIELAIRRGMTEAAE